MTFAKLCCKIKLWIVPQVKMALFHAQRFSKLWYLTPLTIIVDANWIISMKWTSQKTTSLKRNSNIDSLFSLCFIYRLLLNERKNGMQRKREGGTAISIKIGHFFVCVRNLWTLAVLLCLHWIKFRNILIWLKQSCCLHCYHFFRSITQSAQHNLSLRTYIIFKKLTNVFKEAFCWCLVETR